VNQPSMEFTRDRCLKGFMIFDQIIVRIIVSIVNF
jgi:hypothetical protein